MDLSKFYLSAMIPTSSRRSILGITFFLGGSFALLAWEIRRQPSFSQREFAVSRWVISQTTPIGNKFFVGLSELGKFQRVKIGALLIGLLLLFRREWQKLGMLGALLILGVYMNNPSGVGWLALAPSSPRISYMARILASHPGMHYWQRLIMG
jgi:hypothetical protein